MFCLVDGNNFYVSCERVFNPKLIAKPVIVLSNNDGCVVSRSNEAKAIGIKMGEPYHKCKRLVQLNNIHVLSSNYELYADMSDRITQLLATITPDLEIYSIDESFLYLNYNDKKTWYEKGLEIKAMIYQQTGIPVGIGFGKTKTLAKLANKLAKQLGSGVCCIHDYDITKVLKSMLIEEIWGISHGIGRRLRRQGIYNAWQLREAPLQVVRSSCHSVGEKLKLELMEVAVMKLEIAKNPNKQIISSRSFGMPIIQRPQLYAALTENVIRATEKLRAQQLKSKQCYAFLQTSPFKPHYQRHGVEIVFENYTSVTSLIVQAVIETLATQIKDGMMYTKSGIILSQLSHGNQIQASLFNDEKRQLKLDKAMKAYDAINQKWGKGTITISRAHQHRKQWRMKQTRRSQHYSTKWYDIKTIQ